MINYDIDAKNTAALLKIPKNANRQYFEIFEEYGLSGLTRLKSPIEAKLIFYLNSGYLTGEAIAQKLMRGDLS